MTYPWPTLMPMGIVVISCVRPSVQPSMGLGLCIAYKALGRNGLQFGMLMYPDGLHSAFMDAYGYCCWSVCPSICPFVRLRHFQVAVHLVRVGAKEGGSHYWEMAVAITCGYGDICCHYWQHILVVFGTNFVSSLAILQHISLLLTIKFGKIKCRFSSCNRFNFSLSIKLMHLWNLVLSCSSYMWT